MTSGSFDERIRALANRVGVDSDDLDDEHVRWGIYSRAMGDPGEWPALLELVREEPDPTIASPVVVGLLEVLPDHLRRDFVSALPVRYREHAEHRAHDIAVLERISTESQASSEQVFRINDWSNWLQLRAASTVTDVSVLEPLSSTGKTKRIRAAAERRLTGLQLRAANSASDVALLEELSSTGKTRRIRTAAERRLRFLRGGA